MTRAQARALRGGLDTASRARWSAQITAHILAWDAFQSARAVMAYASVSSEPDTWPLLQQTLALGKRLLLPRCLGRGVMEAVEVKDLSGLAPGLYGIPSPPETFEPALPGSIDLVLAPGLLFDQEGRRLGQGGGYYDRFLAGFTGISCGVAFAVQVVESVEVRPRDMPVDAVVTEQGLFRCGGLPGGTAGIPPAMGPHER